MKERILFVQWPKWINIILGNIIQWHRWLELREVTINCPKTINFVMDCEEKILNYESFLNEKLRGDLK